MSDMCPYADRECDTDCIAYWADDLNDYFDEIDKVYELEADSIVDNVVETHCLRLFRECTDTVLNLKRMKDMDKYNSD